MSTEDKQQVFRDQLEFAKYQHNEKLILGNKLQSWPANLASDTKALSAEHCRWLFNQEVQIITFSQSQPIDHFAFMGIKRQKYTAIVLPKACTLKDLLGSGLNDKILMKAQIDWLSLGPSAREVLTKKLLTEVEKKIGEVVIINESYDGGFWVQGSALPAGYCESGKFLKGCLWLLCTRGLMGQCSCVIY